MKIVFFCISAHGHTNPTLGIVKELIKNNHEVYYYSYELMKEKIESSGAKFIVSSCDILYTDDLEKYNADYLKYTKEVAQTCNDRDLTDSMVIGTSALIDMKLDGAVGMNSGIFNTPFIIWSKYKKKFLKYYLTISFQYHHTQMDGSSCR